MYIRGAVVYMKKGRCDIFTTSVTVATLLQLQLTSSYISFGYLKHCSPSSYLQQFQNEHISVIALAQKQSLGKLGSSAYANASCYSHVMLLKVSY